MWREMENNEDKKKKKKELNFETFAVDSSGTLVPKEKTPTPFRTKIKENQLEKLLEELETQVKETQEKLKLIEV